MQEFKFFVTNFCVHDALPIVFGVTADGTTVGVRVVHMPYALYMEPNLDEATRADEDKMRQWLDSRVRPALEARKLYSSYVRPAIQLTQKGKLVGYQPRPTWMVKVVYDSPANCRRDASELRRRFHCRIYHHNLDALLVYTATTGVRCFAWATCTNPTGAASTRRFTTCDIEYTVDYRRLRPASSAVGAQTETETEQRPPPLRVASFDIETDGLRWDEGHELRMIGVSCEDRNILLTRHRLEPSSIRDYCVIECGDDESTLIRAFVSTLRELKPVFLTGWNIFGFDLQFLFERAKALGVFGEIQTLSWLAIRPLNPQVKEMSSNAYGQNKIYHDDLQGLITLDGYILARKSLKMPSYTLKAFGEWIGNKKGDVSYEDMVKAFTTRDPVLLGRVADYCMQDARLVPSILRRMEEPDKVMAMTRLASVPPVYAIKRGQSILTYGLIVAETFARDLVINPLADTHTTDDHDDSEGYQGATVIEPLKGYHRDPVAVLDFESLYPSIMLAYNICISTLVVTDTTGRAYPAYSVIDIGNGTTAVFRRDRGQGVVPSILETLLGRRKAVKRLLADLPVGSVEYGQANAKQLALKVACNSVYGYFGASTSQLYVKKLAAAVTAVGRQSLFKVQRVIQDLCDAGEVPATTHVVYGDSVTGDTPLLLRFVDGKIVLRHVADLDGHWQPYHGDKQAFSPSPPIEVWQDGGFTKVELVIRHVTAKPVLRVMAKQGFVDCTADHSLLRPDGQKVSPMMLQMGDRLLRSSGGDVLNREFAHSTGTGVSITKETAFAMGIQEQLVTDDLLNAPMDVVAAYWEGYTDTSVLTATSKMQTAALYVLAQRLGYSVSLFGNKSCFGLRIGPAAADGDDDDDDDDVGHATTLVSVLPLPALRQGQFVYDLQTASHHFGVGPGSLVVHNTDSVMVKFPGLEADLARALAHRIETECTQAFPRPMRLEFENLFSTYLLENKKRYAGRIHGPSGKTIIKGLSTQRRDFPLIIQKGLQGVLDRLLDGGDGSVDLALRHVETVLSEIATNNVAWESLCITKELNKHEYKTPPPHLVVAQKITKRNPQDPPKPGDRISFVVLHGKGNVSDRAEDYDFVKTKSTQATNPDLVYYVEQLCSQCQHLMDLCDRGAAFEKLRQKYVIMARLLCERQGKLSTFFRPAAAATAVVDGSANKKRTSEGCKENRREKKQSSLNSFFSTK